MDNWQFDIKKFEQRYVRKLLPGVLGCTLSHQKCYQKFLMTDDPYVMIFEDDLVVARKPDEIRQIIESLKSLYEQEKPIIILFSGWFWWSRMTDVHGVKLGRVIDGFLAQSYLINKAAARLMLEEKPFIVADDWKYFRQKGINIYGVRPRCFEQLWSEETNSSIDYTDFANLSGHWSMKIRVYVQELSRKLMSLIGHFESCAYLDECKVTDYSCIEDSDRKEIAVIKAYIINLERSIDRKEYMKNIMKLLPFISFEFIKAVDGRNVLEQLKER